MFGALDSKQRSGCCLKTPVVKAHGNRTPGQFAVIAHRLRSTTCSREDYGWTISFSSRRSESATSEIRQNCMSPDCLVIQLYPWRDPELMKLDCFSRYGQTKRL